MARGVRERRGARAPAPRRAGSRGGGPRAARGDPVLADWRCWLGDPARAEPHSCQSRHFPLSPIDLRSRVVQLRANWLSLRPEAG